MVSAPELLKVLGDPARHQIVEFLADPVQECCSRDDGVCGCDIEAYLGLSQPTVSHHMKQLVAADVVKAEKRGRWVYYELVPGTLMKLSRELERLARSTETVATP